MPDPITIPNNLEIEKALKELEEKSNDEQTQKIVEASKTSEIPKIVQLVMKWFGVREQKQAEYILLGFVIVAIFISLFLILSVFRSPLPPPADKIIWVAGP